MNKFYAEYQISLKEIHDDVRSAIKGLSTEALDWKFGKDANSIAVLIVHLIGAERYWIGDVVLGQHSGRDRASEFVVRDFNEADLIERLAEIEDYIQKAIEPLCLEELEGKRISPRNGREVSVGWALCHALTHTALHLGHIQITRQMWDSSQLGDGKAKN